MSKYVAMAICITLGAWGFSMILGDNPDSIKTNSSAVMQELVESQKSTP